MAAMIVEVTLQITSSLKGASDGVGQKDEVDEVAVHQQARRILAQLDQHQQRKHSGTVADTPWRTG